MYCVILNNRPLFYLRQEVNEVVQKMAGGDRPVPLWTDEFQLNYEGSSTDGGNDRSSRRRRELLFSLQLRLRGITMTGTTPTQSAVRLETGAVELHLSNRIYSGSNNQCNSRIYGKAQVSWTCINQMFDSIHVIDLCIICTVFM